VLALRFVTLYVSTFEFEILSLTYL